MGKKDWQDLCRERKQKQIDSIPKEWLIETPPDSQRNVMDVPITCDHLLSALELEITEVPINELLSNLASGRWSCITVTTAFYKRAIIAHQLVRSATVPL
jgi:amidase